MTRQKKLAALTGALAVLCALCFGASRLGRRVESAAETQAQPILGMDSESVTAISYTHGGEALSFSRTDGSWVYDGDGAFPLAQGYINAMVDAACALTAEKTIDAPEGEASYGLDAPACTVVLSRGGEETTLRFGSESSMDGCLYVSDGDGKVYLTDSAVLESFDYTHMELVQKETLPSMQDVTRFTVTSGSKSYELDHIEDSGLAYSDEYVWFYNTGEGYMALDTQLAESFIGKITGLSWGECVSYSADEAVLESCGLDTPMLTVTVDYTESVRHDTGMTDSDGQAIYETRSEPASLTLEIGEYTDAGCCARIKDSAMVYMIDASICDSLLYTSFEALQPDEVLALDFDGVYAVDITYGGETYTVKHAENDSGEYVWTLDGNELAMQDVFDYIQSLYPTSSGAAKTPERQAEISFVFHRGTEGYKEVELIFYAYDSTDCLVSLNGEARLTVSRSSVENIINDIDTLIAEGKEQPAEE